jgi:hypothetical protein
MKSQINLKLISAFNHESKSLFVHFGYLFLEGLFGNVPLQLHSAGEDAQSSKRDRPDSQFFCQLKSKKTFFLTMLCHFLQNEFLQFFVLNKLL